ncbi:TniQ family protein [Sphaerotilus sp.]|uniref:TniQ family protein n=1 Tax=Sphaerotilus sp. TaxID=2093942 RepID=UPI00286E67EC|nr:TniQ family protein [Sphaerotilus sp.]
MLRPSILPGEYALGYQGRFACLNGWRSEEQLNQALLDVSGHSGGTFLDVSRVEALSMAAGLTVENFVSHHTTIPLRRAFVADDAILSHGNTQQRDILSMSALKHMDARAYFCQVCMNEDLTQYGLSYWRRMHQILGAYHCPTHCVPLCYSRGIKSFKGSPLFHAKCPEVVSFEWVLDFFKCAPILRYVEICMELLNQSAPKRINLISSVLRAEAKINGIHHGQGKVNGIYFSDYILDILNVVWLEKIVPEASTKFRGTYFQSIDGVLVDTSIGAAWLCCINKVFEINSLQSL